MADPMNDDLVPPRWEELIEMTDEQALKIIDRHLAASKARPSAGRGSHEGEDDQ